MPDPIAVDPTQLSHSTIVAAVVANASDPGCVQRILAALASAGSFAMVASTISAALAAGQVPPTETDVANLLADTFFELGAVLSAPCSLPQGATVGAVLASSVGGEAPDASSGSSQSLSSASGSAPAPTDPSATPPPPATASGS